LPKVNSLILGPLSHSAHAPFLLFPPIHATTLYRQH
jgi:hypothetical protein